MSCKGICYQYKASRTTDKFYYLNGRKRCTECEIFLDWSRLHCPCCGHKLRTKPRNIKANERRRWFMLSQNKISEK